jgi:hypothetical protein
MTTFVSPNEFNAGGNPFKLFESGAVDLTFFGTSYSFSATNCPTAGNDDCLWPLDTKLCLETVPTDYINFNFNVCPTEEAEGGFVGTLVLLSEGAVGPIPMTTFVGTNEFNAGGNPFKLFESGAVELTISGTSYSFSATNCP